MFYEQSLNGVSGRGNGMLQVCWPAFRYLRHRGIAMPKNFFKERRGLGAHERTFRWYIER